jgi:RHS repeat-associated protein
MPETPLLSERTFVGHPVDIASGQVFTVANDFIFHGPLPLVWQRQYSTGMLRRTPLGIGWTTEFFCTLEYQGSFLLFTTQAGSQVVFPIPPPGGRSPHARAQMELLDDGDTFVVWNWHHERKYHFTKLDGEGLRLTRVSNDLGDSTWLEYTGDRLDRLVDCARRRIQLHYGPDGLIESLGLDSAGGGGEQRLVRYEHDPEGRLVASHDRGGGARLYEYDARNRMVRETNRLGGAFSFRYDDRDRCVWTSGDDGFLARRLEYDDEERTTIVTDSLGRRTVYGRNALGQLESVTRPSGAVTQRVYGPSGQLALLVEPGGRATGYAYDEHGHRVAIVHANGTEQTFVYNDQHQLVEYADASGAGWHWTYAPQGGIESVTDPLGNRWRYERGEDGHVEAVIAPTGQRTEIQTDPGWRWLEQSDERGTWRLEFDEFGYVAAVHDPEGLRRRYRYDANYLPVAVEEADGVVHTLVRDAHGNVVEVRHSGTAKDHRRNTYNVFDALVQAVDGAGGVTGYEYNTEGDLVAIVNENGERATWEYDEDGNVSRQTFFDGRIHLYERDESGQVTTLTTGTGDVTRYKWDEMLMLVECTWPDGMVETFEYDELGNLVRGSNPDSEIEVEYNALGAVIAETCNGHRVECTYDELCNVTSQTFAQGSAGPMAMTYDEWGLLRTIALDGDVVHEYEYDPLDRTTRRTLPGGVEERSTYDRRRRLARQEVVGPDGVLLDRAFRYDPIDDVEAIEGGPLGDVAYAYSPAGPITREEHSFYGVSSYDYDPAGNVTRAPDGPKSYSAGGRLVRSGSTGYDYDPGGNLVRVDSPSGSMELRWDGAGRLREVTTPDGARATYAYDVLGRRIRKAVDGASTDFVWFNDDLAAEVSEAGVREYLILQFRPILYWQDGEVRSYVHDPLYTPRELIHADGTIAWSGDYDVFTRVRGANREGHLNPIRGAGRFADAETGLYYNYWRYLDPRVGRYVSPDPLADDRRLNSYWAGPNLVNWLDPFGLDCDRPACGEIGVDRDGVYTDPAGRRHESGVPANVRSIALDSGESRSFPNRVRRGVNAIGDRNGCSTCPAKDPGTKPGRRPSGAGNRPDRGNWVVDHDPPISQGGPPYRARPQCLSCSNCQGGTLSRG